MEIRCSGSIRIFLLVLSKEDTLNDHAEDMERILVSRNSAIDLHLSKWLLLQTCGTQSDSYTLVHAIRPTIADA